jgi:steroid delta-isomerase-like uncharacterized protein
MAYDNTTIIRRIFNEVWSQGNLSAADELIAEDHVGSDPIVGEVKGLQAFKAWVRDNRGAFPDLQFVINDLIVSGDKVVVRWTATGTHKGPFMGVPPTGKFASVEGITFSRMANGKSIEQRTQWDTLRLLQTLGLVPSISTRPAPSPQPEVRH